MRLGAEMSKLKSICFLGLVFLFSLSARAQCPNNPVLTPTTWGGATGNANFSGGVYTLSGTGTYSNNQSNEQGFADLMTKTGNGQIQARVSSESGFAGSETAAGIFIRDDSTRGANGSLLWLEQPGGSQYVYADRTHGGNIMEHESGTASIPYWIRLQNLGGVITPALSPDGINWTPLQSYDLSSDLGYGATLSYGLMVWSDSYSQATTVTFDNACVSAITPIPTFPPTPAPTIVSTPPVGIKAWPNPFTPALSSNDETHFLLPTGHGSGKLLIADLKRRKVRSLDFRARSDVQWDGKDDSGMIVPSGVYIYLVEADGSVSRGTVTVMR